MTDTAHIWQPDSLYRVERRHIEATMRHTMGNKRKAAQLLGIARSTLIAKLKQYAMEDESQQQ